MTITGLCLVSPQDLPGVANPPFVPFRTLNNWEIQRCSPTESKSGPCLRGLEKKLDSLEAAQFFALASNFIPADVIAAAAERAGFDLSSLDGGDDPANPESPRSKRSVAGADASLSSVPALAADSGEGAANV